MLESREDKAPLGPQKPGSDVEFGSVLAAARSNAGWAFEWLFFAYTPRVRAFFRLRGADAPDEVEELTNDVFASAFRSLERFDGDELAFKSWLFTIARNRLIDEWRKNSRRVPVAPLDAARSAEAMRGGDVENEALDNLAEKSVRRLLDRLSPDQCEVLSLRILDDLSVDEVARIVEKHPGAVKALQRRGLAAMRRLLGEQDVPLELPVDGWGE